jgi:hypothetical protein
VRQMGRSALSSAVLFGLAVATSAGGSAAPAGRGSAPVFRPVLGKLGLAALPVYLPTWLPAFEHRVYPVATVYRRGPMGGRPAYEADVSFVPHSQATAALAFWIVGDLNPLRITKHTRRIQLRSGVTGYVEPNLGFTEGLTVAWRQGRHVYMVGRGGTEAQLIRIARSVVRVH